MNYKEQFGEWAYTIQDEEGRDPSVKECEEFRERYINNLLSYADSLRDE